jgi:uncharacterized protein (DUF2267 family)
MDARTFFDAVAERLRCDPGRAEGLALAVLRELRDRLTPGEAADVGAQLPATLKRIWQEGERADRPVQRIGKDEFVGRVRRWAGLPDDAEAEHAVRVVFAELQHLLGSATGTEGEAWDVFSQLPRDLKGLWLGAAREVGRGAGGGEPAHEGGARKRP